MTKIKKIRLKYSKKQRILVISFCLIASSILIMGIAYLSKINIYEDLLITSPNQKYSVNNIKLIGKSVFNREVILSKESQSSISLESYYLNDLVLIIDDSICSNNVLQLQINNNLVNIDLSKPNLIQNNQNYYNLNYTTNGNFITKIKYILKCNYVNFGNIFNENISKRPIIKAIIMFSFLFIISLLFYYWFRRVFMKKSINDSKIHREKTHFENNKPKYFKDIAQKKLLKLTKTLIIPFVIFIFLMLIDILIGIIYEQITPEFGRQNLKLALLEYDGINTSNYLFQKPNPYMTYINTPNWKGENGIIQNNNLGYRDTSDVTFAKDSNCIRILAIGGSTTYGSGVDNPKDTYPFQLEKLLNDSIKKYNKNFNIQVINGGLVWGTSAELLNHYIFQDRYLSPDIVIISSGINDIQPALYKDYNPDYSNWRTIKTGGKNGLRKGEGWFIKHSNIIKLFYTIWYSKLDYATSQPYIHTRDTKDIEIEELRKNVNGCDNSGFYRNIDLLVRNILNDGSKPIFFQEYVSDIYNQKYSAKSFNNKDKEMYNIMEFVLKKNEILAKKVCKKYNIEYIYMENYSIPPKYMDDVCHLTKEGDSLKAKFVGSKILPLVKNIIDKSD